MSRQITIRLPDELVDFVDRLAGEGPERSRAAVVAKALERERRRIRAVQDAKILSMAQTADDFDDLAGYAARLPIEDS